MYKTEYLYDVFEAVGEILVTSLLSLTVSGIFALAIFILNGIALYTISKKLGFKNYWLSFVPILNVFILGKIAQKYIKNDGNKSAEFGPLLLGFKIIQVILEIVFFVLTVFSVGTIIYNANSAIESNVTMTLDMFYSLIPVIVLFFVLFAVAITYKILYYVALWRVFAIICNENATLFTVLSIFISFLAPIFLFVCRNREPKFTFEERMNLSRPDFEFGEE